MHCLRVCEVANGFLNIFQTNIVLKNNVVCYGPAGRLLINKSVFVVVECRTSVPNTRKPSDLEVNKVNMHMTMYRQIVENITVSVCVI